jgi:hypothetical protein
MKDPEVVGDIPRRPAQPKEPTIYMVYDILPIDGSHTLPVNDILYLSKEKFNELRKLGLI